MSLEFDQPTTDKYSELLQDLHNSMNVIATYDLSANKALKNLLKLGRNLDIHPKSIIYQEGATAEFLYIVSKGLVKLTTYLPNGKAKIVRICQAGSLFGLESLLGYNYQFYAHSISSAKLVMIPKTHALNLKKNNPKLYSQILENVFCSLQNDEKWNAEFTSGSVKARVARILCYLCYLHQSNKGIQLICGEDMAALASATIESISRVLAEFKRAGLITAYVDDDKLKYNCDLKTLLLFTMDDKQVFKSHESHKEQRRCRRGYINTTADVFINHDYIDTAKVINYSRQGVFLKFSEAVSLTEDENITICLHKAQHNKIGKEIRGKVVRRTQQGVAVQISEEIK